MRNKHLYILTLCLSVFGLSLFLFKFLVLGFPVNPDTSVDVWNAEARITFEALNKSVKLHMFIPSNSPRFTLANENFISRGYGLIMSSKEGKRIATWSIRKAKGRQTIYYKTIIRRTQLKETDITFKKPDVQTTGFEGAYLQAVGEILTGIRAKSADVETFIAELIMLLNTEKPDENTLLLLGPEPSASKKIDVAVRLLAHEGIPARVVNGIKLEELQRESPILQWLEVYYNNRWQSFDPLTGDSVIPHDHFPWWRGAGPISQIQGGINLKVSLSVTLNKEAALYAALERSRVLAPFLFDFSLFSLPINTQAVYHILLLIPMGSLLLVIFRNVIGITTFGTFMPVLIALAFRETKLLWGVVLFISIITLGLGVRFYFEKLKLLLVPRLASLLTVVVLLMAVSSILSHKLGLERALSVALFPMVIITMTIERMSIVWEERGAGDAIKQGIGSLIVAAIAYLIMTNDYVEHFIFVFPEILLLVLSITLLLGRYSGYRLWELIRFKSIAKGSS